MEGKTREGENPNGARVNLAGLNLGKWRFRADPVQ